MASSSARPARRRSVGGFVRFLVLWLGGGWAVVGTLLAPVLPGGWLGVLLLFVVTTAPLGAIVASRSGGRYPGRAFRLFVLRPFWYAQLLLPLAAVGGLLGSLGGLVAGRAGDAGRWTMLGVVLVAAAIGLAGYVGSRRLVVRRVDAWWPDLPAPLDGFRVAQLSDTHVGPHTSQAQLARARRAVVALDPHLVAVTGDLIDDHAPDVAYYAEAFAALRAPHGVVAIPGNHDVYAGWDDVRRRLAELPLTVLVNEHVLLDVGGATLAVVGTGDPAGGRGTAGPNVDAALDAVPPGVFTVALAHNPALWPQLSARGVRLTLSGHTHWGQFALPSLGWSLATPFLERSMGAHEEGTSLLYIHPGTNYWGIPFRLGARPEVALVTLRRGTGPRIEMGAPAPAAR